ncbi:MAG: 1-(5-phosphoribosyl)-5-[(5-phosphoribosylamino)methylideneamino]imidazole-4-carboxamide isomerase [Saccharofermentanales bacterium]
MSEFIIYPAIDLLGGKCVRLEQGRYDKVTVYSDDPLEMAESFSQAGAQWIHMVDLDAAKTGTPQNHRIIAEVAAKTGLRIQTGGGIRTMDILDRVLDSDVSRAVIGTSAVRDRIFTEKAILKYGGRIAIGIDASGGEVAVDGWISRSGINILDFAHIIEDMGAETVIYTDISRDGMLTGTETEGILTLIRETHLSVIASGGIGTHQDVLDAKATGASGVIIGKALYEGKVDLKECLRNV